MGSVAGGKRQYLGHFGTAEEAAEAYAKEFMQLHGTASASALALAPAPTPTPTPTAAPAPAPVLETVAGTFMGYINIHRRGKIHTPQICLEGKTKKRYTMWL